MLGQLGLLSAEETFVTPGRKVFLLVGVLYLKPGDLLGVTHAPLMRVRLNALQRESRATGSS